MGLFVVFGVAGRGGGDGAVGGCGVGRGWWVRVAKEGGRGAGVLKLKNGKGERCFYNVCGSLPSLSRGVAFAPPSGAPAFVWQLVGFRATLDIATADRWIAANRSFL